MNRITNGPSVNQYMETSKAGVFACGNVVHVNDLVDNVSSESEQAGRYAAKCAKGALPKSKKTVVCKTGRNVRYVCPHKIAGIISFSGILAARGYIEKHGKSKPDCLITHGKSDDKIKFEALDFTRKNFTLGNLDQINSPQIQFSLLILPTGFSTIFLFFREKM